MDVSSSSLGHSIAGKRLQIDSAELFSPLFGGGSWTLGSTWLFPSRWRFLVQGSQEMRVAMLRRSSGVAMESAGGQGPWEAKGW